MSLSKSSNHLSLIRVFVKGFLLFIFVVLVYAIVNPLPALGKASAYNLFLPGRLRLPYGEKPDLAYNLSLYNIDAMFASQELANGNKPPDEYRVFLIGDSSVWGYLLKPENTIAGDINAANLKTKDGRNIRAYNLGYPTLSLAKDLVILDKAMKYNPDLVIWLVTLESFPVTKQIDSPIVQNNPVIMQDLIQKYSLNLDRNDKRFVIPNFWDKTLIGDRRELADILRLQLYGIMWAATGIDQYYPSTYEPPQEDLANDVTFHSLHPPTLNSSDLSFDILSAGLRIINDVPIIFINEPIYLSQGENSEVRYNFFYPRWAYDQYRAMFGNFCQENNLVCLDEWDLVSPHLFTNSAIHMDPQGTQQLADDIESAIQLLQTP